MARITGEWKALPGPVAHLAVLGTGGAIVAAAADTLWNLPRWSPESPERLAALQGELVGLGGWANRAVAVYEDGQVLEVDLETKQQRLRTQGPCRAWVSASEAVVSARIVPASLNSGYRSDVVELWDERWNARLVTLEPKSRDCFEVDHISLSADGRTVAWTGLDVVYTSEGDWSWGQSVRLQVARLEGGLVLDSELTTTSRPSEHEPIEVAISRSGDAALAGSRLVRLPGDEHDLDRWALRTALHSGWALAEGERVALANPKGEVLSEVALGSEVTCLVSEGEAALAALADRRVVRIQNT